MADVFISYKSERVGAVAHLAQIIEAHGFSVWFDVRGLQPGPSFGPQIEAALREAKVALVLWCGLSKRSDWVIEEADLAKELNIYVPAHMEAGQKPPLGYRTGQALQLQDWTGDPHCGVLDAVFETLEERIRREAVTARRRMSDIRQQWQLRGRPNFLGENLEDAPNEAIVQRVWSARRAPAQNTPKPIPPKADKARNAPLPDTPSARAWAITKGSKELHAYDDFLIAFPSAPEADVCRSARAALVANLDAQAAIDARKAAFEALPRDGYDLTLFDAFIKTHLGTDEAFSAARMRRDCAARIAAFPPPDDETREQWELEAAVSVVLGEAVPMERRPYLRHIAISGYSDDLFEGLKQRGANLADVYVDPKKADYARTLKAFDFMQISTFSALTTLDLRHTQVSDLAPIETLSALTELNLSFTEVSDLAPIKTLSALSKLYLYGTSVTDWSPADHIDNVPGRPDNWVRKPGA